MLLDAPTLICFSGLPGVGKTTIAKLLASILKTPYLRIDTIEQAILKSSIKPNDIGDAGYQVAYSIAKDNLASKQSIISDSVNPYMTIRDRWLTIVQETKARIIEVEIICSDVKIHKMRVENRLPDIEGHLLPKWEEVIEFNYSKWTREHLIIDTALNEPDECIRIITRNLCR